MKYQKYAALLMATALVLAGCGSSSTDSDVSASTSDSTSTSTVSDSGDNSTGKETVRVLVPGLSEEATIDPVSGLETKSLSQFQDFLNEQIPEYNIEVKTIAWDGWIQSLEAMIKADEIDVGFYTNQEAVPDWYVDLTPYLEKDEELNLDNWDETFIEPAIHYSTYKSFNHPEESGNIYGLPITMGGFMITYDSQLFEEWGVEEPTADMTLSEIVDLAEKMTGTNPVTGKTNYGAYIRSDRAEWYALSYDAVKPYFSDTMDINDLDLNEYIEYIKDSDEVRTFFTDLQRIVNCSNPAISTGSGSENWLTEDNDIAINFDNLEGPKLYMQYVVAGDEEITSRYKALMIPAGENGEGFPEFFHFSIAQSATNKDAAWEVIKEMTTNKEIVDYYLSSYAPDKVSCLVDTEGITFMDYEINQERHDYQAEHMFITDDYWYWRTPLQTVVNQVVSKEYDVDEAVDAFYNGVNDWVNNIKLQSGTSQ